MNWLGQDDYNLTHIEFVGEFDDNLGNDAVIQNLTQVMHDFAYPQCKVSIFNNFKAHRYHITD